MRPEEYEALEWAAPLPPVEDVRAAIAAAMAMKPKDRTVLAARQLGCARRLDATSVPAKSLYYPSRRNPTAAFKAFVDFARQKSGSKYA